MPDKVITPMYQKLSHKELIQYDKLWDDYTEKENYKVKSIETKKDLVELILLRQYIAL
jgi:hypothetical protein